MPLDKSAQNAAHAKCAQEPIHIVGRIQSHGLLFALSEPDLIVRQVSENVAEILGTAPESFLGMPFKEILGPEQFASCHSNILDGEPYAAVHVSLGGHGRPIEFNCVPGRHNNSLIVELELVEGAHSLDPLDVDLHIRKPLARFSEASDLNHLAQLAAKEIRKLSGFDRVMVYRFDEEWNGEVIGEDMDALPVSYLGLRFPASDIPAQARQLFLLNPLRAIADVDAKPAAIVPLLGPLTQQPLDLTRSTLRDPSLVHLEYLRNMGVRASMTVSIVVKDRLWGMIACHHHTPRRIHHSTRSICHLIGQALASQIALRIDNLALQSRLASRKLLEDYMTELDAGAPLGNIAIFHAADLLSLFEADGLIARLDGTNASIEADVEEERIQPVLDKLRANASRGIASSHCLSALAPSAVSYANSASGALFISLDDSNRDYLLLLRRELVETVDWAGNPYEAVSADQVGGLHPRTSFSAWRETVRGISQPWSQLELQNAAFLREQMLRLRYARKLLEHQQIEEGLQLAKTVAAAADQAKAGFLARMSHDVQTPLNLIVAINSLLLEDQLTESHRHHLEISQSSARRLLRLINTTLDLSNAEADDLTFQSNPFDLRDLLNECAATISSAVAKKGLRFDILVDPTTGSYWVGDAGRLQQVLLNLLGNAVKFTSEGYVELLVGPETSPDGREGLRFQVDDTGCGLTREKSKMIFQSLQQPHLADPPLNDMAGLGLALAKTLVERMHGEIWFEPKPGPGARFVFTVFLAPATQAAVREHLAANTLAHALPAIPAGTRILLAEDNLENAILLRTYLDRLSLSIDLVSNGREALEKRKHGSYDLVLISTQLPSISGHEAAREIRAWENAHGQQRVPLLALTAGEETLTSDFDGHVMKPVGWHSLVQAIATSATPRNLAQNPSLDLAAMRRALAANDFEVLWKLGHN